jgi:hypothetical protein
MRLCAGAQHGPPETFFSPLAVSRSFSFSSLFSFLTSPIQRILSVLRILHSLYVSPLQLYFTEVGLYHQRLPRLLATSDSSDLYPRTSFQYV